ncbi:MAG: hypothetical protein LBC74_16205, partial [Planctomycetaceae bacterium]|nr:hypothetical protein [Planctomycetaceae bacterium]
IQGQKHNYETGEYNRLLSDENYRYDYDREGNRISKTSKKDGSKTKYTWDNRNRLVKVETPTETIQYFYDYQNRLVKRTDNKNESIFVHDNWQIILQFDNKELKPTHRYLWGTRQDELLCDNNNWTLGDHLNTIRDIVKSDGNVAEHLDYNSFGKLISVTKNPDSTFFAYTGKLTDKVSELQWNINRWYDADVGKWMNEDPIGFDGTEVNIARYVNNSCINNIDTDGFETCQLWFSIAPSPWVMHANGLTASVGIDTNPGVVSYKPAEEIYCYRYRTWTSAYNCPGTLFRCPSIITATTKESQGEKFLLRGIYILIYCWVLIRSLYHGLYLVQVLGCHLQVF